MLASMVQSGKKMISLFSEYQYFFRKHTENRAIAVFIFGKNTEKIRKTKHLNPEFRVQA